MRRICPVALVALALAGCGGGGSGEGDTVTIADFVYEPGRVVVAKGTTVSFANRDAAPHTATSKRTGAFDTGTIKQGESSEITLGESGTFAYYCLFHPFMKGTIEVS